MSNPIQVVLDAEAQAGRDIAAEEQAAAARIAAARQQARQILQRNEARTTQVAKRYEARCQQELADSIAELVADSEQQLEQFSHLPAAERDQIAEAVFATLSPPDTTAGSAP
jgi:vacuolar-type H+-ATPase subunit H